MDARGAYPELVGHRLSGVTGVGRTVLGCRRDFFTAWCRGCLSSLLSKVTSHHPSTVY